MSKSGAARAEHLNGAEARVQFHGAANGEDSKGTHHVVIEGPSKGLSVNLIGRQSDHRKQILSSRVNLVSGPAGTGKTFVPVATGIELVHSTQSPIKNIVYVRTPVLAGGENNAPVPGNEARKYARFIRLSPLSSNPFSADRNVIALNYNSLIKALPHSAMVVSQPSHRVICVVTRSRMH